MKFFLIFAIAVFAFIHPGFAQDADECESYPNVPINITPEFDDPKYDFSVDIPTLQGLASDPNRTVHGAHQGLTLGLTRYEPVLGFRVPIKGVQFANGLACAHVDHVDVTIGYKDVTVYIPHEVPHPSCGFDEVMAHEQKHIAVNRQILSEYTPLITEKLQAYLKLNGVFREENIDYATSLLKQKLQEILNDMAGQMIEENRRRQQLVDSAAEYRRLTYSCNGELATITRQYMQGGR